MSMKKKPIDVFQKISFATPTSPTLSDNGLVTKSFNYLGSAGYFSMELDDAGPYADFLGVDFTWVQAAIPACPSLNVFKDASSYRGFGAITLGSVIAGDTIQIGAVTFTAISGSTSAQSFHVGVSDALTTVELAAAINNASSQALYKTAGQTVAATVVTSVATVLIASGDRYFQIKGAANSGTFTLTPNYSSGQLGNGGMVFQFLNASQALTNPNAADRLVLDYCFNGSSVK